MFNPNINRKSSDIVLSENEKIAKEIDILLANPPLENNTPDINEIKKTITEKWTALKEINSKQEANTYINDLRSHFNLPTIELNSPSVESNFSSMGAKLSSKTNVVSSFVSDNKLSSSSATQKDSEKHTSKTNKNTEHERQFRPKAFISSKLQNNETLSNISSKLKNNETLSKFAKGASDMANKISEKISLKPTKP